MSVERDFLSAYEGGELAFFAGAGVSFDSGAVSPLAVLSASARVFLPTDSEVASAVDDLLWGQGVPGTTLKGIPPEVFYEHLLTLVEDREALGLWRVLSPDWLTRHNAELRPNANHLALATYAARFGIPIFTTNFDTLFEQAAISIGAPCDVTLGSDTNATVEHTIGRVQVFKLHGTISLNGQERLDTLATTMASISAVNAPMIRAIKTAAQGRSLVFAGYSGCDIDYFPILAGMPFDRPPFWFVPPGDSVTAAHSHRIKARVIEALPSHLFAVYHPEFPEMVPGVASQPLMELLQAEMSVALSEDQKLLLLALCQQSMGRNSGAAETLRRLITEDSALATRDRALALVLLARVEDCRSEYVRSVLHAKSALRVVSSAAALDPIDRATIRVRAVYQRAMSRQQQIGPNLHYRNPHLDWRPSFLTMGRQLAVGICDAIELGWLARHLKGGARVGVLRARHAVNDHIIMLFGRSVTFLEALRLTRFPPINIVLRLSAHGLLRRAMASGDYFCQAGAQKYLRRLQGASYYDNASATYGLLRDPLNYAIVRRDAAVRLIEEGELESAVLELRAANESARACGSRATQLKAIIGLVSCDAATSEDLRELGEVGASIEGAGYRHFWATKLQPFLQTTHMDVR
jgi:SIR2-like domain